MLLKGCKAPEIAGGLNCAQCDRSYKSVEKLREHLRRSRCTKAKCPHCPYETERADCFKIHLSAAHRAEVKPVYKCRFCGYVTHFMKNYKSHLKTMHMVTIQPSPESNYRTPINWMASKVSGAGEEAQAQSAADTRVPVSASMVEEIEEMSDEQEFPPTSLAVITSSLTVEEIDEMPEIQEILPTRMPVITCTSSVEDIEDLPDVEEFPPTSLPVVREIDEMPELEEIGGTTSPVPSSIVEDSQTMLIDTGDHLIVISDAVVEISTEPFDEGGDSAEHLEGVGVDSVRQYEVKLLASTLGELSTDDCFIVRKGRRRRRTGATREVRVSHQQQTCRTL